LTDIAVRVEGVDEFASALDALQQRMHSATRKATKDGIALLKRRTHSRLSRYYHPPNTPTPSPPGEPPARISGHLRGSLAPTGPIETGSGYTGQLGPTAVYGRIQELGGQAGRNHSVTLPPRPYLAPTMRDARGDLRRQYLEAWRRAMP
jgi:phage gpG-like protein